MLVLNSIYIYVCKAGQYRRYSTYLLRQNISIVDTFVFVFVSIIKITKVFVIVSISHK